MLELLDYSNAAQAALIVWCMIGYYVWFDAIAYAVRKYESNPTKVRWFVALIGGLLTLAILLIAGPVLLARRWYYR